MNKIKVIKISSTIKTSGRIKDTMKALGLNKIGSSNVLDNSDAVKGMIKKVAHLVRVENA